MGILLRNTQHEVKTHFAHCAMAAAISSCDLHPMHIRLKEMRERLGLTLEQMSERTGFSVSQLSRWESGNNNIPSGNLPKLADSYRCSVSEIFTDDAPVTLPPGPLLYIKGSVQAGQFIEAWEVPEDEWERYAGRSDVAAPLRQRFGLRVMGESMNEIYPPGTILDCVEYTGDAPIANGKRVIVRRKRHGDGIELTVKEYMRDADGIEWLVPRSRNPAFQSPFRCDHPGEGIEFIDIYAIVVASIQPE